MAEGGGGGGCGRPEVAGVAENGTTGGRGVALGRGQLQQALREVTEY